VTCPNVKYNLRLDNRRRWKVSKQLLSNPIPTLPSVHRIIVPYKFSYAPLRATSMAFFDNVSCPYDDCKSQQKNIKREGKLHERSSQSRTWQNENFLNKFYNTFNFYNFISFIGNFAYSIITKEESDFGILHNVRVIFNIYLFNFLSLSLSLSLSLYV